MKELTFEYIKSQFEHKNFYTVSKSISNLPISLVLSKPSFKANLSTDYYFI